MHTKLFLIKLREGIWILAEILVTLLSLFLISYNASAGFPSIHLYC